MNPVEDYSYFFAPGLMPMWHLTVFWIGCCVGSFLNVCIWRIPNDMSLSNPPSHCPKCEHRIAWYENIPLFSWLLLRGKCSSCKAPISSRYFLVELLCGVIFYMLWFKVLLDKQPLALLFLYCVVAAFVIAMAFIDFDHRIIPDKLSYPLAIFGLAMAPVFPELWHSDTSLQAFITAAAGTVAVTIAMTAFAILGKLWLKQDALGWGDVKYMAAITACLGCGAAFFTLLAGSMLGSAVGIFLAIRKRGGLRSAIPFGPFLAAGTCLWMLYGERLRLLLGGLFKSIRP